jgi:DNA replication and repair protein RecF
VAVLTIKLSEIPIFEKYKKSKPILLLDDVFSELDVNKRNNLLKYIDNDLQVIITTTELDNIDQLILKTAKTIKICEGKQIEVK